MIRNLAAASLFLSAIPGTAHAGGGVQAPAPDPVVFTCTLSHGKVVAVMGRGNRFVYSYGTPYRAELTIAGSAAARNLFARTDLHGGPTYFTELRFVRGRYSYSVYSVPRSTTLDNEASAGLVVFRNGRRIATHDCMDPVDLPVDSIGEVPRNPRGAPSALDD